jgi:predicted transcriptional regulator
MNNKSGFNRQERSILKTTFEEQRPMSTKEIADRSQMSWITAKKYVKQLLNRGWLLQKKKKVEFQYSRFGIKRRVSDER